MIETNNNFINGAKRSFNRKWQPLTMKDLDELIPELDYKTIVSSSRRLFSNVGIVKGAIEQKAMYSIGNAWVPYSSSKNTEWKTLAEDYLRKWFRVCDVTGYDMVTFLYLCSVSIDRDGDCFVLLTSTDSDYPQIQLIPAHQVDSFGDAKTVSSGEYKGFRITKGVIHSKNGRALAYRVKDEDSSEGYRDVSASNMMRLFDTSYYEAKRGTPLFAHALNEFRDMAESSSRELFAQMIMSSLVFVENNPIGGPQEDNPFIESQSIDGKPISESFDEGTVKFFRSGDGSNIAPVESNRPSINYLNFHQRLERLAMVGAGWPTSLLDDPGRVNTNRLAIRQGEKACQDRQALLENMLNRVVAWVIAKAIKNNTLPPDPDYYKWTYSKPAFISIDLGRDSNALREEYKMGFRNLTEIVSEGGKNLREHLEERVNEYMLLEDIIEEAERNSGKSIDRTRIQLLGQASLQQPMVEAANQ